MTLKDFDTTFQNELQNPEFASHYIQAALDDSYETGDIGIFLVALREVAQANRATQGIPDSNSDTMLQRTLFRDDAVALSVGMDHPPPGPLTASQMMALPFALRERIFAAQAEEMAAIYQADLALPPDERELTAFSSFDGPFREPGEYLT